MAKEAKKRIGELLIEMGVISEADFTKALEDRKDRKTRIGELLIEKGFCTDQDIALALASQLGLPIVDLKTYPVEPAAIEILNEKVAIKHLILPLSIEGKSLNIAVVDPLNLDAVEDIRFISGLHINLHLTTKSDIQWAIDRHYHIGSSVESLVQDISSEKRVIVLKAMEETEKGIEDLKKRSEAAPIVKMVDILISKAVEGKASDIHVEPTRDSLIVRNRIDGHLRVSTTLPKWVQGAVISRIKVMTQLDIAEKRMPQDGRLQVNVGDTICDLRVSTLPTAYGEKVVIRILDPKGLVVGVEKLGFSKENERRVTSLISKPQGIFLLTGPTGTGKTTTLYTCLAQIRSVEKNITTIEDPIEYDLEGINQVAINEKAGLNFANTLRSLLRQDPDVVMVGEMRDLETAQIAMQAALTGHLVFSTVHTRSCSGTITRLRELGIPSYLVSSTIIGIVAQRLVRRICPDCIEEDSPGPHDLKSLGIPETHAHNKIFYVGKGCPKCNGSGYKGRLGVHEVLVLSPPLRDLIVNDASEQAIKEAAMAEGMKTLLEDGIDKALNGQTTISELLRTVHMDDDIPTLCVRCGTYLRPGFVGCPMCGQRVNQTCALCQKTVKPEWNFCPYCTENLAVAGQNLNSA